MNMRQQRITTSQQEVYLIYLMEHTDFAASKIKDGDCCCSVFFRFPLSVVHISVRIMCWKCAVVSRSGLFFFHFSFLLLDFALTGESKYEENWKELTKMLNNTLGPKKTVEEWKMVSVIANHSALPITNCTIALMNYESLYRSFSTGRISYALVRRN